MDLYFKRHDGQAVTCEDFFAAMRDANNADFANFLLWCASLSVPHFEFPYGFNAYMEYYETVGTHKLGPQLSKLHPLTMLKPAHFL